MTKFTKGPWVWCFVGSKVNGCIVGTAYDDKDNQLSGFINDDLLMDEQLLRVGEKIGEQEGATYNYANAHLIAAAPELYAALENTDRYLMGWRELIAELDDLGINEALGKAMWAAVDQIDGCAKQNRTALEKARGES